VVVVVEGGGGCDIVYIGCSLLTQQPFKSKFCYLVGLVGKKLLTFYVLACLIT
jgi:hypothetical protein